MIHDFIARVSASIPLNNCLGLHGGQQQEASVDPAMYCYSQLRRLSSATREVSLYALLEVAPTASVSEIKRAFRQVCCEKKRFTIVAYLVMQKQTATAPAESKASSPRCQPHVHGHQALCKGPGSISGAERW